MADPSSIEQIVFECITSLNKQLPPEGALACDREAALLADGGVLDSLGLITLMVALEEALLAQKGVAVPLLDTLMSEHEDHPFQSVGRMIAWISHTQNMG